jgi:hypothetical protein
LSAIPRASLIEWNTARLGPKPGEPGVSRTGRGVEGTRSAGASRNVLPLPAAVTSAPDTRERRPVNV